MNTETKIIKILQDKLAELKTEPEANAQKIPLLEQKITSISQGVATKRSGRPKGSSDKVLSPRTRKKRRLQQAFGRELKQYTESLGLPTSRIDPMRSTWRRYNADRKLYKRMIYYVPPRFQEWFNLLVTNMHEVENNQNADVGTNAAEHIQALLEGHDKELIRNCVAQYLQDNNTEKFRTQMKEIFDSKQC